ncbi:MAG: hypothetical protein H6825_00515 [Planctomycetes bacterium]|nr:hypothetical protein [Planctomycetota bacterium]
MPLASTRTLAAALTLALLAPATFAGGTVVTSVQPGDWSSGSTWSTGALPQTFDSVHLDHEVELSLGDETVHSTTVGTSQPASLTITGGILDSTQFRIGVGGFGALKVEGGQLTTELLLVGSPGGVTDGQANLSGGSLVAKVLIVGPSGQGILNLVGSDVDVKVPKVLQIGSNGRLAVHPDALDRSGLSAIQAGDVEFDPGSRLTLDTKALKPRIGDVWDVISYAGLLAGAPSSVETSDGYAAAVVLATPGVVSVVVTQVPPFVDLGGGSAYGMPPMVLDAESSLTPGIPLTITLADAPPPLALLWISVDSQPFAALGGTVYATPYGLEVPLATGAGDVVIPTVWPVGIPAGTQFWMQAIARDTTIPGLVLSNALRGTAH